MQKDDICWEKKASLFASSVHAFVSLMMQKMMVGTYIFFHSPHSYCLMSGEISLCRLCCQLQPFEKTNKHIKFLQLESKQMNNLYCDLLLHGHFVMVNWHY